MPNLGGVNDQGNSPRAFWFSKGDLDLIWPLVRSGFGVLALFFHFAAGVKSVDHFGAGLSCHQSPHRKLRTTTAKIRSVCIRLNRKRVWRQAWFQFGFRRDCHGRRFQFHSQSIPRSHRTLRRARPTRLLVKFHEECRASARENSCPDRSRAGGARCDRV